MWVITYHIPGTKSRIASFAALYAVDAFGVTPRDDIGEQAFIAAPTRKACIALFLQEFGYTWPERAKGINCEHVYSGDLNLNAYHTQSSVA